MTSEINSQPFQLRQRFLSLSKKPILSLLCSFLFAIIANRSIIDCDQIQFSHPTKCKYIFHDLIRFLEDSSLIGFFMFDRMSASDPFWIYKLCSINIFLHNNNHLQQNYQTDKEIRFSFSILQAQNIYQICFLFNFNLQDFIDLKLNKMIRISIALTILLVSLFSQSQQISTPMAVSPNHRYTGTGTFTIDTSSTYANSTAAAWNPTTYTIAYPSTLGYISIALVYVSIKDLSLSLSSKQIQFNIKYTVYTSLFVLNLYSNLVSKIQTISFNYLVLTNSYITDNLISYQYVSNVSNYITSSSSRTIGITTSPFNITGGVSIIVTYMGINANTTTSQNIIDLALTSAMLNSSYLQFYLKSKSSVSIYVQMIYFNFIVINKGYYNRPNYAAFSVINNLGSNYTVTNTSMLYSSSYLICLNGINIQKDSFLDFHISTNSPDSFTLSTNNQNDTFSISYLIVYTYYCHYSTPYLYNNSCYDICPPILYGNADNLVCQSCSYDCYTCTDRNFCRTCNSTKDHRIFNSQTERCVPLPGYYQSGITTCSACRFDCYICINYLSCVACDSNNQRRVMNTSNSSCIPMHSYYESNTSVANKCRYDCLTCDNGSACLSCDSQNQYRNMNNTDRSCRPMNGYYQSNISVALKCNYDCISCDSSNKCTVCDDTTQHRVLDSTTGRCIPITGYYQTGLANCQRCPTNCLTCHSATVCDSCVQGYQLKNNSNCEYASNTNSKTNTTNLTNSSSINTTNSDSLTGSAIGILVGGIIGSIVMTLLLAKIIHFFCIKNQERYIQAQRPAAPPEPIEPLRHQLTDSHMSLSQIDEQIVIEDLRVWHQRRNDMKTTHTCSICLDDHSYLRQVCKHYFHLQCIIEWMNRRMTCPLSRRDLSATEIRIVCVICRKRQKKIQINDIIGIDLAAQNTISRCNTCIRY